MEEKHPIKVGEPWKKDEKRRIYKRTIFRSYVKQPEGNHEKWRKHEETTLSMK
jgi:hypothetical protein